MEKKCENKRRLRLVGLFILLSLFLISSAYAKEINYTYNSNFAGIQITQLKYEPYPVSLGEYFDIWIKAYTGSSPRDVTFELIPTFPFSLDENENPIRNFGSTSTEVIIKYRVRVSKDAVEGINKLDLRYNADGNNDYWVIKSFDIQITDSRTNFDAVIQEVSGSDVSIAIANIGKYTANSVVVRIPEQEAFRATGTNGQMVGNLESGDYTIVGFSISPKGMGYQNNSRRNATQANFQGFYNKLKFDIYYTDNIGERRIVNMELPLATGNSTITGGGNFVGRNTQTSSAWYSSWLNWIIILGILIVGFIIYKKYPKIKSLFKKKSSQNSQNSPNKIPDWIRNAKEKEKNK